jgi:hypothetical protein
VFIVTIALLVSAVATAQIHDLQPLRFELTPPRTKHAPNSILRKVRGRLPATGQPHARRNGELQALEALRTATGRLRVTVRLKEDVTHGLREIVDSGLEIENAPVGSTLIQGTIDASDLSRIAGLDIVASVGPLDIPIHRIGSITTEGDSGSAADAVRQQGLDGAGITVGVISDGIDALATAQASGDLGPVTVPPDSRCHGGSGDEGTALLEIVHDLAPGAQLIFSGPGSSVEMIESVRCLTAAGADVIVDDLGFLLEPYFEDGPVAAAVLQSVMSGVSYHSAAGNDAEHYLEADFHSSPGNRYHDFLASNGANVDNTDTIVIPPGDILQCVLQWGDPFGASGNDYDLYLLNASLSVVDSGVDVQAGDGDPVEFVAVVNTTGTDQIAHVVIDRFAGQPRRMKLLCFGGTIPEYVTPAGSIFGHAALSEVVAVGAVDQAVPGRNRVEDFSSRGPVALLFPTAVIRAKPDVVALDGVSISNAGGFPSCPPFCRFFGTSAAAPHTAGVAALMLQRTPGLSPAALLSALQLGATDIESPGRDTIAGAGLVNALLSVSLVSPTTTSTSIVAMTSSTTSLPPTTSSSVPSGTTTSTTLGNLSCTGACPDDGDECTVEKCEMGTGCLSVGIDHAEGVLCLLYDLHRARQCDSGEISVGVAAFIGRKSLKAQAHTARSIGAPPKRYLAHVRQTLNLLHQLVRKVDIAAATGRLKGVCKTRVVAALARAVSLAESTVF